MCRSIQFFNGIKKELRKIYFLKKQRFSSFFGAPEVTKVWKMRFEVIEKCTPDQPLWVYGLVSSSGVFYPSLILMGCPCPCNYLGLSALKNMKSSGLKIMTVHISKNYIQNQRRDRFSSTTSSIVYCAIGKFSGLPLGEVLSILVGWL